MHKTCASPWCQASFDVSKEDLALISKFCVSALELRGIPPPTLCPDCRQQRRLARRNERTYYQRSCSLCGNEIIAMYPQMAPFPVYCYSCWWSDRWDPLSYGCAIDVSHPLLEQFHRLQTTVPRIALYGKNNENCTYINHSVNSKNGYLCVDVAQTQDTYYSKWVIDSRNCCDCYQLEKSELCYESQYSVNLTGSIYAFLCDKSSSLAFCYDCEDCHDCFLCAHLRHKRWCIGNEQLSEKEYKDKMRAWDFRSHRIFQDALRRYHEMWGSTFHRDQQILFSEDCSGDFLYHCKNVRHSFGVIESRDCSYCYDAAHLKDCMDAYEPAFDCELQYDSHGCNGGKRLLACHICYDNDSLAYCDFCHNSSHLFGCIGLRRKQHCILNRQYTKEEYEVLVPKIIAQMCGAGAWAEYLPVALSPFAYDETVASEYFPLSKRDILQRGWRWKGNTDEISRVEKVIPAHLLPDSIDEIPDDVLNWAIECEVDPSTRSTSSGSPRARRGATSSRAGPAFGSEEPSGSEREGPSEPRTAGQAPRPFRIVRPELEFYRRVRLPLPRLHPDERHRRRMAFTNSRKLHSRTCAKCSKPIQTTYQPSRPEIVYCESCYLQTVY